ncbi:cyclic nucleotide-binding domain-containing protein [Albimonas sp. CAU 1670]|uniref:cyclic nucleotide-binding domain-containing protein n=1 Tax=Albimonas sp. CAU 1670 TaxID=3032599 RepID=UPI0023DA377E|nr:cyclic nucleotide-binding domain-containing protein [Albimonas sp. CAU 1670]MDF2234300.1 cyclic nucleotide-binding domain-containing protein [Albimonas sp. CAU 1670]
MPDVLSVVATSDALGYLAAFAVFLTFCMQTMLALRVIAVLSNLAFISYAVAEGLMPILVLHGALLPLNLMRLAQMRRLPAKVEAARRGEGDFAWLAGLGERRRLAAGQRLFARGDLARSLFVVVEGEIEIEEIGVRLGPGECFGEIGLLAEDGRRSAGARAVGEAVVSEVTDSRFARLHYDNPRFAYAMSRLVANRLLENERRASEALRQALDGERKAGALEPIPVRAAGAAADRGAGRAGLSGR